MPLSPRVSSWIGATCVLLLVGCPGTSPRPDAGTPFDAGQQQQGTPCTTAAGCSTNEVCRDHLCTADAPCTSDPSCLAGESCLDAGCRFTGCRENSDCSEGSCHTDTFSCAPCTSALECPSARPICLTGDHCVACTSDEGCPVPGPSHCSPEGVCAHCVVDVQCPNGLSCGPTGVCEGVPEGSTCPAGTACAPGLVCVNAGGPAPVCARACDLQNQQCLTGEVCNLLQRIRSDSRSFIFGPNGPLGVCFPAQGSGRALGEHCARSSSGSNCQPNLFCVPDSAQTASCRAFCSPNVSSTSCKSGERCVGFPGDLFGREYGLCLPDDGFGDRCTKDSTCRTGLSCQPYEDPHSITNLSNFCQYPPGAKPGLGPCGIPPVPDGGFAANQSCQSGRCASDPFNVSSPFYCFAPCASDAECSIGGRSGVCDVSYSFTSAFGIAGSVIGCRPACTSRDTCLEYGAGFTCRSTFVRNIKPSFVSTCGPELTAGGPGEPCYAGYHCRSGYCSIDDGRGAQREGFCSEACTTAAQCQPDAGAPLMPMDCANSPIVGFYGFDGKGGTPDDVVLTRQLCTGKLCADDTDCFTPAGTGVCAPDADPDNLRGALIQRCKPANPFSKLAGETCGLDIECSSSACGQVALSDGGPGPRLCFQACTGGTTCANGTTCRANAMTFSLPGGPVRIASCVP